MEKPNILWICTDQQRFDSLACYGDPVVETPCTSELAKNGVRFEHAYCQAPVCTPSRASFLTGRYPRTTRCRQNGQTIPADEILIGKMLQEHGYKCGLAGKLHIAPCEPCVCDYQEKRVDDGYDAFYWSHGHAPKWPGNQYIQFLTEHGLTYETPPYNGSKYIEIGMPEEYHQTTWCANKAIEFMESNGNQENPWFFSVNIFDPHHPFDPPLDYLEKYVKKLEEISLPAFRDDEPMTKPYFQHYPIECQYTFEEMSDDEHRLMRAAYYAMVDLIDVQLGRMMDCLKRTGQLDNTIVIFTSDHGEILGDHKIYLKGPYFYDSAVRVPLIISCPRLLPQKIVSDELVELVDIVPTLLDLAQIPQYPSIQGKSLVPLLLQQVTPHRTDVYCEYYKALRCHENPSAYATMVRTKYYKLVRVHGLDQGELYDLTKDPNEFENLWDHPDYLMAKSEMLSKMTDRMAFTVDPLPVREAWW